MTSAWRGAVVAVAIAGMVPWGGGVAGAAESAAEKPAMNPTLVSLEVNKWIALHEQKQTDKVRFRIQEHGGGCFDTKRCRFVLYGSNTHGKDWTNTPLIFDVVTGEWTRCYPNDSKDTYKTNAEGVAVAGEKGDHPWAMHTFGAVNYDPDRDEMVVCCYPGHLQPGNFTDVLKDVWGTVKKHPTWTFRFADNTWVPLPCEPVHFFPHCTAFDTDRKVVVGYGAGIWELQGEPRTWKRIAGSALTGYHNNAVYDSKNKAILVFGSNENSNDMVVYRPATGEHKKMPTPGDRPPKDQHNPMCFDPESGRTVVIVDREMEGKRRQGETWLYDLGTDSWQQFASATLPFGVGMNFTMEYDPRHKVCLLVASVPGKFGNAVTVFALKIDPAKAGK